MFQFRGLLSSTMDFKREHFRAMILYDYKFGLNECECRERLVSAFEDYAPSRATVFRWFAQFKRGIFSLNDDERNGRPATSVTEENVLAVKKIIKEDPKVTYKQIEEVVKISSPAINEILHNRLGVRKLCSRWVPHSLTAEQKEARVTWCKDMLRKFDQGEGRSIFNIITGDESWIYQYDPPTKRQSTIWVFPDDEPPTKVKRGRSVGKKMVATFFSASGHVATISLDDQKTVNAKWYIEVCLPTVFNNLKQKRPKTGLRGLFLHHDNASPHKAIVTKDFLKSTEIEELCHPPYSPDLAPCDFFLFPKIKLGLRDTRFNSPEDARNAYLQAVEDLPKEEYRECYKSWFRRMNRCIEANGEYFEKL